MFELNYRCIPQISSANIAGKYRRQISSADIVGRYRRQISPANIAGLVGCYIFGASISLRIVLNGRIA
jgi:hypothetical protein